MGNLNLQLIDYLLSHAITFTPLILIFFFKFVINIEQSLYLNLILQCIISFFYSHLENDATLYF